MNKFLLGSLSLGALLLTSSIVDARTLMGVSDWSIRQVSADVPYCTLSRNYDTNVNFKLAKNQNGEGTIALDFKRNAFDLSRVYPVKLQINDIERAYTLRPASQGLIIIRIGTDESLFNALQNNKNLTIQIDSENFDIDLGDYQSAMRNLNGCIGQGMPPVIDAQNIPIRPAVPPIQEVEVQKDSEIDNLLAENRRLTEMLSNPPMIQQAQQPSPLLTAANSNLIQNLDESDRKLNELKLRLAEIERNKNQPKQAVAAIEQQLNSAEAENARLKIEIEQLKQAQSRPSMAATAELTQMRNENVNLKQQLAQLERDLLQSRQSINPDTGAVLKEKDAQIAALTEKNAELNQQLIAMNTAEPQVVIKEIVREVPIMSSDIPADDAEMKLRLAEAETQALSLSAERDEYRRLLQNERRRLREAGNVAGQLNQTSGKEVKLIEDVRRLEAERADLMRELEFTKSSMTAVEPNTENDTTIAELNAQMAKMQDALAQAQSEKMALEKRMTVIDSEAALAQRQLAEMAVNKLADDRPESIEEELELKTLRAEIAALEAQNKIMRMDAIENIQSPPPTPEISAISVPNPVQPSAAPIAAPQPQLSSPIDAMANRQELRDRLSQNTTPVSVPVVNASQQSAPQPTPQPQPAPQMVALSGDEIRQLVSESRLPLKGTIDRIERVSGPDFAAFRWDTGFVYGSGEQSRLNDMGAFEKSVKNYIAKTQSRCTGNFDETMSPVSKSNAMTVMTADIACIDDNANGNAASILFFAQNNMFYALAHEADMDTFTVAMDMRDRMTKALKN